MALNQLTENEMGIVIEYWKVSGLNVAFIGERGFITVTGYLTKEARFSDKDQVMIKQVKIEPNLYGQYFSNSELLRCDIRDICYKYIKENDEFFGNTTDIL